MCGLPSGLFIYGYSCYYYFARSDMSGFMQTSCESGTLCCLLKRSPRVQAYPSCAAVDSLAEACLPCVAQSSSGT